MLTSEIQIECPYCGESFSTLVDGSAGDQNYVEDCYVCCRPIVFDLSVGADDTIQVRVRSEDDSI